MTALTSLRRTPHASVACLVLGTVCFGFGAASFVLSRNLFDGLTFGRRASESLSDLGVMAYAADLITNGIIRRQPDLIAFRPMLYSGVEGLISTRSFHAVLERAAVRAHVAVFSERSQRILLSLPDLNVLVHDALSHANPAIAARIPKSLDSTVSALAHGKPASIVLSLARAGHRLRQIWPWLFGLGFGLYLAGLWLAPDRRQAMARIGIGLIVAGLFLASVVALNPLAGIAFTDDKELRLIRGLWRTYLGDFTRWGFLFVGLGVLVTSGASSLLERVDAFEQLSRVARVLSTAPKSHSGRILWGFALFLFGGLLVLHPVLILSCGAVVAGVCVAYTGSRELFRVFLDGLERPARRASGLRPGFRRPNRAAIPIGLLVLILGAAWFHWRNPAAMPVRASVVAACNGFPELCDRRIDEVVFAGAHNAMSNQEAAGWMFPHHEADMPRMLRDGIRAFLIDVHYGFAGGARIKTDMRMEPTADKIKQAIGDEAYAAAMRIRDRLVGVDESQPGLYFCHGFCELGAYSVAPALRRIRDFLVTHPDEVIVIIVEDTVTPQDLAAEFEKAGLKDLVYTGNPWPRWPTLRDLIENGGRLLVFTESGRPGVPWLRPAFETFQETPYSFHKIEDFSCRANRGGDKGPLLLLNHWIETTPTPKPSNAAIVNAYPFLLARARQCADERRHLPNVVAVDFFATGDLVAVVNRLNGIGPPDAAEAISVGASLEESKP